MEMEPASVSIARLRKSGPARAILARDGRRQKRMRWPVEVRDKNRDVFDSYRRLVGLRRLGLSLDSIRIDVRSRRGQGVWVMARGFGNPIAHGKDLSQATAALVMLLAPDIEAGNDADGKRLAGGSRGGS